MSLGVERDIFMDQSNHGNNVPKLQVASLVNYGKHEEQHGAPIKKLRPAQENAAQLQVWAHTLAITCLRR